MSLAFETLCFILSASWASSSISGISYIDPLAQKPLKSLLPGEDPCNPLYWYPRNIPEYCYNKIKIQPMQPKLPAPEPIHQLPPIMPMPMPPMTIPMPYPMPPPMPIYPPPIGVFPSAVPQLFPPQFLPSPIPQTPYGVPFAPSVAGIPYPPIPLPTQQAGLVPGIPGIVSQDGGINILPFSDAYSDMLEKHKQKMIRKRLQRVLDDYKDYPRKQKYRKYKGKRH